LSASRTELEAAIDRVQAEGGEVRKALKGAEKRLSALDAAELAASAAPRGEARMVVKVLEGKELDYVRGVATEIVAKPGMVALLGGAGCIVLARSQDVPVDLRPVGKDALAAMSGKGGGPAHFVQGGGSGDAKAALALAEGKVGALLT
jgi:alanyl-tRNA synthetase